MSKHLAHFESTVWIGERTVRIRHLERLRVSIRIDGEAYTNYDVKTITQSRILATSIADRCVKIGIDITEDSFVGLILEFSSLIRDIADM